MEYGMGSVVGSSVELVEADTDMSVRITAALSLSALGTLALRGDTTEVDRLMRTTSCLALFNLPLTRSRLFLGNCGSALAATGPGCHFSDQHLLSVRQL
jgi:hypothetical protein